MLPKKDWRRRGFKTHKTPDTVKIRLYCLRNKLVGNQWYVIARAGDGWCPMFKAKDQDTAITFYEKIMFGVNLDQLSLIPKYDATCRSPNGLSSLLSSA